MRSILTTRRSVRRRRPSAGVVLAIVALFVALGGSSYAAVSLPKASVGAPQIKQSAVNSKKVQDGSLLAKDFKRGQLPKGAQGPAGPQGPQGPQGQQGQQGVPGMSGYQIVNGPNLSLDPGDTRIVSIACPAGKLAVGGGYESGNSIDITLNRTGPTDGGSSWAVRVTNESAGRKTVNAQAVCVNVAS
jgi:hypothetical protein